MKSERAVGVCATAVAGGLLLTGAPVPSAVGTTSAGDSASAPATLQGADGLVTVLAGVQELRGGWRDATPVATSGDTLYFSGVDSDQVAGLWGARPGAAPTRVWEAAAPGVRATDTVLAGDTLYVSTEVAGRPSVGLEAVPTSGGPSVSLPVGEGSIDELTAVGDRVFFAQFDGRSTDTLWRTDGTRAGTQALASFPYSYYEGGDALRGLTPVGTSLWFAGRDTGHGAEPWRTDGTRAGTRMVRDVNPGAGDSAPTDFVAHQGRVWFTTWGKGLQRSDGTSAGTVRMATGQASVGSLIKAGNALYLFSDQRRDVGGPWRLWRTDGTNAGTRLVGTMGTVNNATRSAGVWAVGNHVYALSSDKRQWQLWRSDGSSTRRLVQMTGTVQPTRMDEHAVVGRTIYFSGSDREHGEELWVTDGTALGTRRAADLRPGRAGSRPQALHAVGGAVWFKGTGAGGAAMSRFSPTAVFSTPPSLQVAGVRRPLNLARPRLSLTLGTNANSKVSVSGVVRLPHGRRVRLRTIRGTLFAGAARPVTVRVRASGVRALRAALREFRAAPRSQRPRRQVMAVVTVKLRTREGQRTTSTVRVPLR